MPYLLNLQEVNLTQVPLVGGKNASLGEMIHHLSPKGVPVPLGFATTTDAFQEFLAQQQLHQQIAKALRSLKISKTKELNKTSAAIRQWIMTTAFPPGFEKAVIQHLKEIKTNGSFAVRSSATAEDLPDASFAGQQETFLNVSGTKNILQAIKLVFASLFTSRAIAYRFHHQINHEKCAMSVGIQSMVKSEASGVMFTLDTESGFDNVILINAAYGLGEALVQGKVNPDEYYIYKPTLDQYPNAILQRKCGTKELTMIYGKNKNLKSSLKNIKTPLHKRQCLCLSDDDVYTLARYGMLIEKHYAKPMDIEWAKDKSGKIYILQARPETIKSRENKQTISQYQLTQKSKVLVQGLSVGQSIGSGRAKVILDIKKIQDIQAGEVLVADMTDPDWEPIMKKASAIVTNRGGRTCHAAIVARELGIPAVVGCTDATKKIKTGQAVTVSCAEGETGLVYEGKLPFKVNQIAVGDLPKIPVNLCLNVGNPDKAFSSQFLPNHGVGLARLEFIISSIGIHPHAALNMKKLPKPLQKKIKQLTTGYPDPVEYYVAKLCEGIAKIAAAFHPKPVIFRFSDFKSNEYANLLGGDLFEPKEENPMLGFRGASRYYHEKFRDCFALECQAFKRVHTEMGLTNAQMMIPFVRTVEELKNVLAIMASFGLKRSKNVKIYMMCEIPSNVILAKEFLELVDGYSIGSNDLTQLVLGLDRDSTLIAPLFDERNAAVKTMLKNVIAECRQQKKYIGICGQGPSDYPDFALWLMEAGIECMSLSADSILETWLRLGKS